MKKYGKHNKTLAIRFEKMRKLNKLTRKKLASILMVEEQSIYNYESANRKISKQIANLFASAFSFNPNYLLDPNIEYYSQEDRINDEITNFNFVLRQSQYMGDLMISIIINLAKLNGYELESKAIHNEEKISLKDYFAGRKELLILKKDNNQLVLSDEDISRIGNNISDKFQSDIDLIAYFKSKNRSNA